MAASGLSRRRALTGAAGVGLALPVLAACGDDGSTSAGDPAGSSTPSPSGSPSPTPTPSGSASAAGGFATAADIPVGGGAVFPDEGVVVTQPTAGTFQGFGIQCTHAGCPVNEVTETINCPCHASTFSIADGSPLGGPATEPLSTVELSVQGDQIGLA
ncbi:Rieske (2Fe-2S) protein [Nocardioides sp. cx-169]|uniref:Rieske (2Fe-2S) protein n=1 Tax=Nocardioides sp. cx-169 TaxID=2899080 RepID=UPI001E5EC3D1|nr:Rieske (2Fe-2S) protein [Nocardioides sp. cx-169]MCD4535193.1 Rieske (2Fe-2S) protein [Nocardioides sp. cx-169]